MAMGFNCFLDAGLAAANRVSWRSMIFGPMARRREETDENL